jgi:hypothetical protein
MYVAFVNAGDTVSLCPSTTSTSSLYSGRLCKLIAAAGHTVHIYAINMEQLSTERIEVCSLEGPRQDVSYDVLLVYNSNFSAQNREQLLCYKIITALKLPINYIYADYTLPLKQLRVEHVLAREYKYYNFTIDSTRLINILTPFTDFEPFRCYFRNLTISHWQHFDYFPGIITKTALPINLNPEFDLCYYGSTRKGKRMSMLLNMLQQLSTSTQVYLFGGITEGKKRLRVLHCQVHFGSLLHSMDGIPTQVNRARASLIIGDREMQNLITPIRVYEAVIAGVVAVVDKQFDENCDIFAHDDTIYKHCYFDANDMQSKLEWLKDDTLWHELVRRQRDILLHREPDEWWGRNLMEQLEVMPKQPSLTPKEAKMFATAHNSYACHLFYGIPMQDSTMFDGPVHFGDGIVGIDPDDDYIIHEAAHIYDIQPFPEDIVDLLLSPSSVCVKMSNEAKTILKSLSIRYDYARKAIFGDVTDMTHEVAEYLVHFDTNLIHIRVQNWIYGSILQDLISELTYQLEDCQWKNNFTILDKNVACIMDSIAEQFLGSELRTKIDNTVQSLSSEQLHVLLAQNWDAEDVYMKGMLLLIQFMDLELGRILKSILAQQKRKLQSKYFWHLYRSFILSLIELAASNNVTFRHIISLSIDDESNWSPTILIDREELRNDITENPTKRRKIEETSVIRHSLLRSFPVVSSFLLELIASQVKPKSGKEIYEWKQRRIELKKRKLDEKKCAFQLEASNIPERLLLTDNMHQSDPTQERHTFVVITPLEMDKRQQCGETVHILALCVGIFMPIIIPFHNTPHGILSFIICAYI